MQPTRLLIVFCAALVPAPAAAQPLVPAPHDPAGAASGARAAWAARYQEARSGRESSKSWSGRFRVGPNGSLDLNNIAGHVEVTGVGGDEIRIEAIKRVRARDGSEAERQLESIEIEAVERAGRVQVRTLLPRSDHTRAEVDYTIQVPYAAGVIVRTVAGDIKAAQLKGDVRLESISGDITAHVTPRLSRVKSVSGDVEIADTTDADVLTLGTVSGNLVARRIKARALDLQTVSGDVMLHESTCERAQVRSVSGNVEFAGRLAPGGRYEFNSHSGDVRVRLSGQTGFELSANTFSGSLRSDLPLRGEETGEEALQPVRGRHGPANRELRGTFGDGSALLVVKTFSGSVVVATDQPDQPGKKKPGDKKQRP